MREVFVDTSGWASYLLRTEGDHSIAASSVRQLQAEGTRLVTTNYVLAELVALFGGRVRSPRSQWVGALDAMRSDPWVELITVESELDAAAWALLRARLDKDWSLVDCASFVVMRKREITDALTADHHFEQAGFTALLR